MAMKDLATILAWWKPDFPVFLCTKPSNLKLLALCK